MLWSQLQRTNESALLVNVVLDENEKAAAVSLSTDNPISEIRLLYSSEIVSFIASPGTYRLANCFVRGILHRFAFIRRKTIMNSRGWRTQ